MSNELLPCPFCGGEAEMLTAESMHGGYLFGIMCNDCRSRGDVFDTEAEAIQAWNTRKPMQNIEAYVRMAIQEAERTCRGEEIVRCRDCEHHDHGRCWADQWSTASLMPAHRVEPDGFCAWGERKAVASE